MDRLPRAIVLAGGKSSRFGSNKASADVGGMSLIELCVSNLLELFERVTVVAKDTGDLCLRGEGRVQVVCDGFPVYAAMVGLAAGLHSSDSQLNYVTGCDMPLVAPDLIRRLHQLVAGRDCALRCGEDGRHQPLGGFYSRSCLPLIDELIASGDYRLSHLAQRLDAGLLQYEEVVALDPLRRSFCNVNTPADIERVRDISPA